MSGLLPVAVYGLEVPAGDHLVPATVDFPATVSLSDLNYRDKLLCEETIELTFF